MIATPELRRLKIQLERRERPEELAALNRRIEEAIENTRRPISTRERMEDFQGKGGGMNPVKRVIG